MTARHFVGRMLVGFFNVMSFSLLSKKSSACTAGVVVAGMVAASTFVLAPAAQAAITNFDLTFSAAPGFDNSPSPLTIGPVGVDNIILTLSNPQGTSLPTNSLNRNPAGFCAYANVGSSGGRCALTSGSGAVFNGFSLSFDKPVYLRQFDITGLGNISSGTITFGSELFSFATYGTQVFATPLFVSANSPLLVTTTGVSKNANGGVFRLNNLQVESGPKDSVPGPLPLLGAGAAFAYSRKLRTRILKKSS